MPVHGTASTYSNHSCRCPDCTAAATAARAAWTRSLQDRPFADVPHGTKSGYQNWRCRCGSCTSAQAMAARQQRTRG
jgi:hypothetical protein